MIMYAAFWLIIHNYSANSVIPMPDLKTCQEAASKYVAETGSHSTASEAYCLKGKP